MSSGKNQVVIQMGQSNAVGQSTLVSELSGDYLGFDAVVPDVQMVQQVNCNSDAMAGKCATEHNLYRVEARQNSNGYFGPELGIARAIPNIKTHAPNSTYIVKLATGSSNLYDDFNPDAVAGKMLYPRGIDFLEKTMTPLGDYEVMGCIWIQGERDAVNLTHTEAYQANLLSFAARMRTDVGNPDMHFIVAGLSSSAVITYRDEVVTAQLAACAADSNMHYYNTDAIEMSVDDKHYTSNGYCALGLGLGGLLDSLVTPCS